MKNCILITVISLICLAPLFSQSYFYNDNYYDVPVTWETGISFGGMNCLTDLGGKKGKGKHLIKDCNWNFTQVCGGLYAGFLFQYIIGARLEVTFGKVKAADNILQNDNSFAQNRYQRNLDFFSAIADLLLMAEFHPVPLLTGWVPPFSPYLLAGIGVFSFNPKTTRHGKQVSLQPLHTEGQGFREYPDRQEYHLRQVNFPAGMGLKYELSPLFNVRLEIIHRVLFTDYLDDVSRQYINVDLFSNYLDRDKALLARQMADRRGELSYTGITKEGEKRGNPANNDAYFSIICKIGVVLGRMRRR